MQPLSCYHKHKLKISPDKIRRNKPFILKKILAFNGHITY